MTLFSDSGDDNLPEVTPDKAFEVLTGPGGKYDRTKYKSEEEMYKAMAYGKFEADRTIEIRNRTEDQLREDYKKLREEYNAGPKIKEVLDRIEALKQQPNPDHTHTGNEQQSVFDEAKAYDMVSKALQEAKAKEREEANVRQVESKLKEAFGPDYRRSFEQKVSELGLSKDFVNSLARSHPEVLYKTLELDRPREGFQAPPTSTHRVDPKSGAKRTWSYYDKMRKEDPDRYNDPKTKTQMVEDYRILGEAFEDGSWKTPRYIH
jgi:hypothetical protein